MMLGCVGLSVCVMQSVNTHRKERAAFIVLCCYNYARMTDSTLAKTQDGDHRINLVS